MHLKKIIIILIAGLFVLAGCSSIDKVTIETEHGSFEVLVDIADTPEERTKGLMFVESLGDDNGMLFVFKEERTVGFWMKNTLIPLDLLFISKELEIADIKSEFEPCEADPCETYVSKEPAMYVLEVNSGYIADKNIKIGDKIHLDI